MAGGNGVEGRKKGDKKLDTVEMINLETNSSCVVDVKLDQPSISLTSNGNLFCGGSGDGGSISNCFNIATRTSVNLLNARAGHLSWSTNDGIYLIGGYPSSNFKTTELITGDTTQNGFTLKYSI